MCHTKAPRLPHYTGQTQLVKAPLLRRASAIFWNLAGLAQEAKWVIDLRSCVHDIFSFWPG